MKKRGTKYRALRRLGRVLLSLIVFFIVLVLVIRSPWGQQLIVNKATTYISDKTGTKVNIDKLFLTFSGNLYVEGLYLEDQKQDTLLYTKSLEANIPISPILFSNAFSLKKLEWEGLKAHITREENTEDFNFSFLINAFASADTTTTTAETKPMSIAIGDLYFKQFDVSYNDKNLGISSSLELGALSVEADDIDLEAMQFKLDEVALESTSIQYHQYKAFAPSNDTTETTLPFIGVENLSLKDVTLDYSSETDGLAAKGNIGTLILQLPEADLANQHIELDKFLLDNTSIEVVTVTTTSSTIEKDTLNSPVPFSWPAYTLKAKDISLKNNTVSYSLNGATPSPEMFNPQAIYLTHLGGSINQFSYQPKKVEVVVNQLTAQDQSGFTIKDISFKGRVKDNQASLHNIVIATTNSSIKGAASFQYSSLDNALQHLEETAVSLNLPNYQLHPKDAYYFSPALQENNYIQTVSKKELYGTLSLKGTLKALQVSTFTLGWGTSTQVETQGRLENVMQPDELYFDFPMLTATTTKKDVLSFVNEDELGIKIPTTLQLKAKATGTVNNLKGKAWLTIPEGKAYVDATYKNTNSVAFDANLKVDSLEIGKILKNDKIGALSFTMKANGKGNTLENLDAQLSSNFSQLSINNYDFSKLSLKGHLKQGKGNVTAAFKDHNLNAEAKAQLMLDSLQNTAELQLHIIGADLCALGVTQQNIKTAVTVSASYKKQKDNLAINALVSDGIAVYNNEQYHLGNVTIDSKIGANNTDVEVQSNFLNGNLHSNASPEQVTKALQQQFISYFRDSTAVATVTQDTTRVDTKFSLTPTPILSKVFLNGVERLDSIQLEAHFDAASQQLNAVLNAPAITYSGITVDSLAVSAIGDAKTLSFSAGLKNLISGPLHVKKTALEGNLKDKQLLLDFSSYNEEEQLVHIASEMILQRDTTSFHINPEGLVFNKKQWTIPQDNAITMSTKSLDFKNMVLSRNNQELAFSSTKPNVEKEHIAVDFSNFKLQTFLSLLNPDEALSSGIVNGSFMLENPFGATGIVADFSIEDLHLMQTALGKLTLGASSKALSEYDFKMALQGAGIDMEIQGDYAAAESGANLNLELLLQQLEVEKIAELSKGALKNSSGSIAGNVKITGSTTNPTYNGNFTFNDAAFTVASFNAGFSIPNETLKIDNQGLYLNQFKINDENNHPFTIDGSILTETLTNPSFNLSLKANEFQLLNSTKEDNELFYGKANFDANVNVKGNLDLPKVTGSLKIRKVTEMTYVVPESQLDVEERDGVVVFVNRAQPDAILTRNDQEETAPFFKGINAETVLEIADDAVFNVVIDEKTGDNLQVSGNGALNLNISPNGNINLSGRYELNSGHYETSLYNLVKRKFEINPGSSITWLGAPTDAKLDVTAIYKVETSAAPLMSSVTSGEDASVTNKYRQVLPFLVYLNVDGVLLQPELSFGLDMPEDSQGQLGGAVYGRVQQLNGQEAELNKQVFSLLALNRFFPDSGSDGSSGGTAAIARDNVNKVLSGELNAFSDKIFGKTGLELDFDLDSFTDYQGDSPQDRTQLNINASKKLFNDRLIVTAGSAVDVEGSAQEGQEATPIIGNVSLEYLLTENGRYRLRGFRKNEYQNIIDGQLIVTGVALIFNREFNKFSELFNPLKEEEEIVKDKAPKNKE